MKLKRILVPFDGRTASEEILRVACLVAKSARGHVVALSFFPSMQGESATAGQDPSHATETPVSPRAVLERAEKVGALYGVEVSGLAVQAMDRVATIVDKARELGSGAIFVELPRGGDREENAALVREIAALMDAAPCPIFLGFMPRGAEVWYDSTNFTEEVT